MQVMAVTICFDLGLAALGPLLGKQVALAMLIIASVLTAVLLWRLTRRSEAADQAAPATQGPDREAMARDLQIWCNDLKNQLRGLQHRRPRERVSVGVGPVRNTDALDSAVFASGLFGQGERLIEQAIAAGYADPSARWRFQGHKSPDDLWDLIDSIYADFIAPWRDARTKESEYR